MADRDNTIERLVSLHDRLIEATAQEPMAMLDAQTVRDALALLKAQEPRIVTEADFENADEAGFIPAWYEEKDTAEVYCECISIGALADAKFGHMRWWTSRPTDEQREAVKWE